MKGCSTVGFTEISVRSTVLQPLPDLASSEARKFNFLKIVLMYQNFILMSAFSALPGASCIASERPAAGPLSHSVFYLISISDVFVIKIITDFIEAF